MLQWFRSQFIPSRKDLAKKKLFPRKFVVQVSIDHPRIIPHVTTIDIIIDAHDRAHAIRQIQDECKLTVGRVLNMKRKR